MSKIYFIFTDIYNYMQAKSIKFEVHIRSEARVCSELSLNEFCPAYD